MVNQMIQKVPHLHNRAQTSKPSVTLVESWLAIAKLNDKHAYNRQRAIDLIKLIFGSIEFAERYVQIENEKLPQRSVHTTQAVIRLHN